MGLYDYTTKEIFNKVFRSAGGGTVALQSSTTQERLNAVLDESNDALRVSMDTTEITCIFIHNFSDEPAAADDIWLPWSDAGEYSSGSQDTYIIAPYDMTFVKMDYATDDIGTGFTGTLLLGTRGQTGSSTTLGNESIAYTNLEDYNVKTYGNNWTGTKVVSKGDSAYFTYEWSAKPKASATDHMFTSVWTMDTST